MKNVVIMSSFKFVTRVDVKPADEKIGYNSRILMLGSCFTTQVGAILHDYRFNVMVNPFGVLYNPCSILSSVERLHSGDLFTCDDVIQTNPTDAMGIKKYASFYHHSSFAHPTPDEFLENANTHLIKAAKLSAEADTVIITLGTAWVFELLSKPGFVVSNCHKRLAKEFNRRLLSVGECSSILFRIAEIYRDKRIIFTVSPIRHFKDGAHGNQISKSTLLLAIDEVVSRCNRCSYFPSYEIMLDELRDYRFYAEDMVHPSDVAVKYIFEKFKESHISPLVFQQMEENMRLTKAENHIQRQIP